MPAAYSHKGATGTGPGAWVDISVADGERAPHMQLKITNALVLVEGSVDKDNPDVVLDYSGGGFTSDDSRELIPGVRYWRTNIITNSGRVTSAVGEVPTQDRGTKSPSQAARSSGQISP